MHWHRLEQIIFYILTALKFCTSTSLGLWLDSKGEPNIVILLLLIVLAYSYAVFVYYVNWLTWRYLQQQQNVFTELEPKNDTD